MERIPLRELTEHGQSIWLDFISRELVTTDRLERLITDCAISGMTSNPTIFEKAIAEGADCDGSAMPTSGSPATRRMHG